MMSEKRRRNISNAVKKWYENGGQNPRKGKHLTAETKRKLSLSKKGIKSSQIIPKRRPKII